MFSLFSATSQNNTSSSGGYDFEPADENTPEAYKCVICFCLMRDVVELSCGHAGCKCCLEKWMRLYDSARKCPTCRKITGSDELNAVRSLDRIIRNDIKIKCKQKPRCKWVGSVDQYLESHEKDCDFIEVSCTYDGCRVPNMLRKDMKDHETLCPFRTILCDFCKTVEMPFNSMEMHQSVCVIKCPNEPCEVKLTKLSFDEHINICDHALVPCNFHIYDCETQVKRMDMAKHLNETEALQHHFDLVVMKLNNTQDELQNTNKILEQVKQDHQKTKWDKEKMKSELAEAKSKLAQHKAPRDSVDLRTRVNKRKSSSSLTGRVVRMPSSSEHNTDRNIQDIPSSSTHVPRSLNIDLPLSSTHVPRSSSIVPPPLTVLTNDSKKRKMIVSQEEKKFRRFEALAHLMENNRSDFFASLSRHPEDARLLSRAGGTLLHHAVNRDRPADWSVRRLIDEGCVLQQKNQLGRTCLESAVARDLELKDSYRMIDALLKRGDFTREEIEKARDMISSPRGRLFDRLNAFLKISNRCSTVEEALPL